MASEGAVREPMRVLVVDDEEVIRYMCSSSLEEAGHSPFAVEDGKSALAELGRNRYDAVLLDMAFVGPPMGRELYELVTKKHPYLVGRIIIITGVLKEEAIQCFRTEGVRVLEKPFELDEMIDAVSRIGPVSG